jgi:hypothetical protein
VRSFARFTALSPVPGFSTACVFLTLAFFNTCFSSWILHNSGTLGIRAGKEVMDVADDQFTRRNLLSAVSTVVSGFLINLGAAAVLG